MKIFDESGKLAMQRVLEISEKVRLMKTEMAKVIVGQEKVIDSLIRALLCNGHVYVEGVPGIGKTLIVRVLGIVSGCETKRVQFTVDLLPSDIVGLTIYKQGKGFEVVKGPVFTNFLIADEVNRSPPKTQSALLESMQEKQVTIGRETFILPKPFFVMATANPIEQAGVYSLPEAQIDRFLFKIKIGYPTTKEEKAILNQNMEVMGVKEFKLNKICTPEEIIRMQEDVRAIYLGSDVEDYIINVVESTRDKKGKYSKYIDWGASPRASIALALAGKAEALISGRNYVTPQDIKNVAFEVLRHRIILNYEAEAENISIDTIIAEILEDIVVP